MSTLSEHLHDVIDMREEMIEQADQAARKIIAERFAEALDATDSLEDALTLVAAYVAKELDPLTTDAVRRGARETLRRRNRARG